jgi:hypothetical protein
MKYTAKVLSLSSFGFDGVLVTLNQVIHEGTVNPQTYRDFSIHGKEIQFLIPPDQQPSFLVNSRVTVEILPTT